MPKCAVSSCKNSSNNIRIKDGVSFFHYPRDQLLASQWWSVLAPVVSDSFKPGTAVVCSDHFHNDHKYMCKKRHRLTRNAVPDLLLLGPASNLPSNSMLPQYDDLASSDDEANMIVDIPEILRPPSESTVCRVCLITEGRMKRVTEENYEDAYKEVTGITWNKEDLLPQHICWECGRRLQCAAMFKRRALAAHALLHALRSDHTCLTLNDIKLIDRNDHQLVSNLSQKHFPPNQYLSRTTINNNKIFSPILLNRLTNGPKKYTEVTENIGTEKECTKDFIKDININTDKNDARAAEVDVVNHTLDDVKYNAEDINLAPYKNLAGTDKSLTDTYRNSNDKDIANSEICKNRSNADNYTINANSECLTVYKHLDDKTENGYNSNIDDYKNTENTHILNLAAKNLEADIETKSDKIDTDMVPKGNDLDTVKSNVKNDVDDYDSDESDILVIDAGNDANIDDAPLETVIKSEYVGAGDGGMSIDELIDIYNNDGDGDERLQELNDRFGDEATVKIEQGWGTQRAVDSNFRREQKQNTRETAAEKTRPKLNKPGDVFIANSIRSRAYKRLNQTLFTLTPVSEAEQIADIFKRQDTLRFKRAPFKCYLCFRGFKVRRAYDTHMLRHDACNGAFECSVCRARQKSPRAVRTHMHGQHSVKISCNDCSFVTMNRSVARGHEKWHAGTKYRCPYCSSQFEQESTYKCHLRTRHVHAFACAICGFTFLSRKGLAVHRCKRHADADQIPMLGPHCDACALRFASDEAYTRHLKLSSRHRPDNLQSSTPGEAVN